MSKFKMGDKVRIINTRTLEDDFKIGAIGMIRRIYLFDRGTEYHVEINGRGITYEGWDLELVDHKPLKAMEAIEEIEEEFNIDNLSINDFPKVYERVKGMKEAMRIHTEAAEKAEGMKFDSDKPDFSLLDPEFLHEFVEVLTFGGKKYAPDNWKKVDKKKYIAALQRHMNDYLRLGDPDSEHGKSHMAAIACNAMFIFGLDRLKALTSEEK